MSEFAEVKARVLARRSERDIGDLDKKISMLERQLAETRLAIPPVTRDKEDLERLFVFLVETPTLLLPVSHELAIVSLEEKKLFGKQEKLEEELDALTKKRSRWLALHSALKKV